MPRIPRTPEECRALGGEVIRKRGAPTWHGGELLLCKIPLSRHPEFALPWQKKGFRVVIMGRG